MSKQFYNLQALAKAVVDSMKADETDPLGINGVRKLISGMPVEVSSLFRLQFVGIGAISIDSILLDNSITTGLFTFNYLTSVNLIESFVAEDTKQIKCNFPSTLQVYYIG